MKPRNTFRCSLPEKGFSLIEVLLSVTLGAVLVFLAVAGFRTFSQGVTVANRLSLENRLLRAGVTMALTEADFWTQYDDPDDTRALNDPLSGRRLRQKWIDADVQPDTTWAYPRYFRDSKVVGLPFTPLRDFADADSVEAVPYAPRDATDMNKESERGWKSGAWRASDPRTWFHGNMREKITTTLRPTSFGPYGIFSNRLDTVQASSQWYSWDDYRNASSSGQALNTTDYGSVQVPHTWRDNQIRGLALALGPYGLADYVPANAMLTMYGPDPVFRTPDFTDVSRPAMFWNYIDGDWGAFSNDNRKFFAFCTPVPYCESASAGRMGALFAKIPLIPVTRWNGFAEYVTQGSGWTPQDRRANEWSLANLARLTYYWDQGWPQDAQQYQPSKEFFANVRVRRPIVEQRPNHWPDVSMTASRYLVSARFTNVYEVMWHSPVTGETMSIAFTALGTTLRGARQQRYYDPRKNFSTNLSMAATRPASKGGWAYYDNDPDQPARNDPTLDSY